MHFIKAAIAVVTAAAVVSASPVDLNPSGNGSCSPLYGLCQTTDHCCPGYVCSTYLAKCIPKAGIGKKM
ncbi:hypothetical protein B0O80DRAFT_440884 [Mortierella sp. GBAus27b]|nr:hypothetical protein B0O80DRAFT_440884 [Mortierella sp. GBAus27b]